MDKQRPLNQALIYIEDKCIEMQDTMLLEFGFETPDRSHDIQVKMREQPHIDPVLIEQQKLMLNETQKVVYDTKSQTFGHGGIMFLDAPGGTGKTFLINLIISDCILRNKTAIAVLSSVMIVFI